MKRSARNPERLSGGQIRALKDFNVRVRHLSGFGLYELAKTGRLRTAAQAALGERGRRGTRRPSQQEIDAFVNNLRFFIQDNEATSFRNLAKNYCALPLSDQTKREFSRCCEKLNRWLDSKSSLGMNGAPLTHREIFQAFIYGNIAHQNPAKRRLFDNWRQSPLSFPLFETLLVDILGKFTGFLEDAVSINKKAIAHLTRQKSHAPAR
jgi:hypothetical protein